MLTIPLANIHSNCCPLNKSFFFQRKFHNGCKWWLWYNLRLLLCLFVIDYKFWLISARSSRLTFCEREKKKAQHINTNQKSEEYDMKFFKKKSWIWHSVGCMVFKVGFVRKLGKKLWLFHLTSSVTSSSSFEFFNFRIRT